MCKAHTYPFQLAMRPAGKNPSIVKIEMRPDKTRLYVGVYKR